jgi:hypothetical protein
MSSLPPVMDAFARPFVGLVCFGQASIFRLVFVFIGNRGGWGKCQRTPQ